MEEREREREKGKENKEENHREEGVKERKKERKSTSNVFAPFMKTFHEEFLFQDSPSSSPPPPPSLHVIKNLRNDKPFLSAHLTSNRVILAGLSPCGRGEGEGDGLIKNGFRLNPFSLNFTRKLSMSAGA